MLKLQTCGYLLNQMIQMHVVGCNVWYVVLSTNICDKDVPILIARIALHIRIHNLFVILKYNELDRKRNSVTTLYLPCTSLQYIETHRCLAVGLAVGGGGGGGHESGAFVDAGSVVINKLTVPKRNTAGGEKA